MSSKLSIAELLAKAKANANIKKVEVVSKEAEGDPPTVTSTQYTTNASVILESKEVTTSELDELLNPDTTTLTKHLLLNEKQQSFVSMASSGRSCCLIGAAGTGKTTAVVTLVNELLSQNLTPNIITNTGSPMNPRLRAGLKGIAGLAFTRRAVANLKKNMPPVLHPHAMTIHGLLEFSPVKEDIITEEGDIVTKTTFEPLRNEGNLLPSELVTLIIDESSMVGIDLFELLTNAIAHKVQIIFIGDLNQLPPVFGDAILGYALLELPTIQLTEVYRQALESPIIRLAHRILSGKPITYAELRGDKENAPSWQIEGKMKINCWKVGTDEETAEHTAIHYLSTLYKNQLYNPYVDMVIIPFNKKFGTIAVSKGIATFLDKEHNIHPLEIVCGWQKQYFAVGDLVLFKNDEYVIKKIEPNKLYRGVLPNNDFIYDRLGNIIGRKDSTTYGEQLACSMELLLETRVLGSDSETTDEASHKLTLAPIQVEGFIEGTKQLDTAHSTYNEESTRDMIVSSRGQINAMSLAYATTCHKAQGLEATRVFILLHKSHAVSLNREWLYTAITRAKEQLNILCERDSFIKGINTQKIRGTTLADKANHFKGKIDSGNEVVRKIDPISLLRRLK